MASQGGRAISTAATPTILISNARTRITEWCFEPSAATGFYRHKYDYVVSPRTCGKLKLIDGENYATFGELTEGLPYFREAGVEHDDVNTNDYEIVSLEVELK